MKKLFFTAAFLLSGCSFLPKSLPPQPAPEFARLYPDKAKPLYLDELILNDDSRQRVIVSLSEVEGVLQLKKLLDANVEESYAFIPQDKKWVEIGSKSLPEIYDSQSSLIPVALDYQKLL